MKKIITRHSLFITNNKGLTLVEVLVATVVLAVGLLGVAMMQYMAIGGNAFGREMQIATELGQERLEIIHSMNYASVVTGNDPPLSDPDPSRFGGLTFNRVWWVHISGISNIKEIAVRVSWVDQHGGNHSVTLDGVKWDETAAP